MKRDIAIGLVMAAALLAGCSASENAPPAETPQPGSETASEKAGSAPEPAQTPSNSLDTDTQTANSAPETAQTAADAQNQAEPAGVSLATVDDIAAFLEENRDKVLVINFWATWCPPCVHEMPELAAFYRAYRDRGVAFLSLSADAREDFETTLAPFVEEHDLPFHVYAIANVDPDELDQHLNVGMDFALPTTFVFDRDRTLAQRWMRNITQEDLEKAVDPLLTQAD